MKWTKEEEQRLQFLWGTFKITTIAEKLKRTPGAVLAKSRDLKLGSPSRGRYTMNALMRRTGYSESRLFRAIENLGIHVHRGFAADMRRGRLRTNRYALEEEDVERIEEYLGSIPDGQPLYSKVGQKTHAGVWGVGIKPPACIDCGTIEKPHCAKGMCKVCYTRQFKKTWRVNQPGVEAGC